MSARLEDEDGTPLIRDRDGDLVPDPDHRTRPRPHLVDKPCTPAEHRAHANRIRADLARAAVGQEGRHP